MELEAEVVASLLAEALVRAYLRRHNSEALRVGSRETGGTGAANSASAEPPAGPSSVDLSTTANLIPDGSGAA
jgi:hypothetical protein